MHCGCLPTFLPLSGLSCSFSWLDDKTTCPYNGPVMADCNSSYVIELIVPDSLWRWHTQAVVKFLIKALFWPCHCLSAATEHHCFSARWCMGMSRTHNSLWNYCRPFSRWPCWQEIACRFLSESYKMYYGQVQFSVVQSFQWASRHKCNIRTIPPEWNRTSNGIIGNTSIKLTNFSQNGCWEKDMLLI